MLASGTGHMERLPSPDRERPARHCVTAPGSPPTLGVPAVPWGTAPRPYPDPASGARWRIGSKFRLPKEGSRSKVTVTNLQPGGNRDPSESAGVCRPAAGALSQPSAGEKHRLLNEVVAVTRHPPQGRHPAAAAPAPACPRDAPARAARASTAPPWPPRPRLLRRRPATSAPIARIPSSRSCWSGSPGAATSRSPPPSTSTCGR